MKIFEFDDYKKWIQAWVELRPQGGYGELTRIAEHLQINSTTVSQVLRGDRDFNLEQCQRLSEYCQLSPIETKYLMQLVLIQRAGTVELKNYFELERKSLLTQSKEIANRIDKDRVLSDLEKALLVSSWLPSAILIYSGKESGATLSEISAKFRVSEDKARYWLDLLVEKDLLQVHGDTYKNGMVRLHIERGSSYATKHNTNWRLKALENAEFANTNDLTFTSISSISVQHLPELREKIVQFIEQYAKVVSASPAEDVVCLNIDFFRLG